jgi:hypothetical protein
MRRAFVYSAPYQPPGIVVNELSSRIGGALKDVFLPWVCGFDILGAVMDVALGLRVAAPEPFDSGGRCVRVLMPFARPGRLERLVPLSEIRALDGVLAAGYNFREGDALPPLKKAGAMLGIIVLAAGSEAEMQTRLDRFYGLFRAVDASGADLLLPEWRIR